MCVYLSIGAFGYGCVDAHLHTSGEMLTGEAEGGHEFRVIDRSQFI